MNTLIILALLTSTSVKADARPEKPKLLVSEIQAERELDPELAKVLSEVLLTELQRTGLYDVTGIEDVREMLEAEANRSFASCDDDNSCLAEIGGALGARYLGVSSIAPLGSGFVVNFKLIDTESASVLHRASERADGDEDALVGALGRAVAQALNLQTETPRPWGAISLGAVSISALVVGVGLGIASRGSLDQSPVDPGYASSLARADDLALGANLAFAVSAAALLGGAYLWYDFEFDARVELSLLPAGAALTIDY